MRANARIHSSIERPLIMQYTPIFDAMIIERARDFMRDESLDAKYHQSSNDDDDYEMITELTFAFLDDSLIIPLFNYALTEIEHDNDFIINAIDDAAYDAIMNARDELSQP
jgi:hypothetical protein